MPGVKIWHSNLWHCYRWHFCTEPLPFVMLKTKNDLWPFPLFISPFVGILWSKSLLKPKLLLKFPLEAFTCEANLHVTCLFIPDVVYSACHLQLSKTWECNYVNTYIRATSSAFAQVLLGSFSYQVIAWKMMTFSVFSFNFVSIQVI